MIHVQVGRYQNEGHRNFRGLCCPDITIKCLLSPDCSNSFLFCLRPFQFSEVDKTCPSGKVLIEDAGGDDFDFTDSVDIDNPIVFEVPGPWSVCYPSFLYSIIKIIIILF